MNRKILDTIILLTVSVLLSGQSAPVINKTDQQGRKQGPWIKNYPDGNIQYEGVFKDDHPIGEFKRYYENKNLSSILIYSGDGKQADATLYHPNGFIAASGKYIDQIKEGKWKFFSSFYEGYLINEETYLKNKRNGPSLKFFPDTTVAEKTIYINDRKEGEWLQFFPGGKIFLKSNYSGDLLTGKFDIWYENGRVEISGNYKNNLRNGTWLIYNEDGTLRYKMDYIMGKTKDRQMDIDASNLMESLEKNQGRIPDPEKTGEIK